MQIRTPAVAGMFYPGDADELKKSIKDCFMHTFGPGKVPPSDEKKTVVGAICPHAGYPYSGPIACHSFYSVSSQPIELAIILGPNHWGIGCNIAAMRDTKWQTPLGDVEVDTECAIELNKICHLVELDFFSHSKEHSIEVEIPMLQETFSTGFKILPISLINQEYPATKEVGAAVAKIAKKKKSIIIGSSDFTHYEENEFAHKQDSALIKPILDLDLEQFYAVLKEKKVSACGYGAIAATMVACKELGATKGQLLKYATSGDVTGDKTSVVGYASIIFT